MILYKVSSGVGKDGTGDGQFAFLGKGTSADVSEICEELGIEKSELTADSFVLEPQNATKSSTGSGKIIDGHNNVTLANYSASSFTLTKTYDPNTGIFSCTSVTYGYSGKRNNRNHEGSNASASASAYSHCKIYLYIPEES